MCPPSSRINAPAAMRLRGIPAATPTWNSRSGSPSSRRSSARLTSSSVTRRGASAAGCPAHVHGTSGDLRTAIVTNVGESSGPAGPRPGRGSGGGTADQAADGVGDGESDGAEGELAKPGVQHRPAGEPADHHPPGDQGEGGEQQRQPEVGGAEQVGQQRYQGADRERGE